MKKRVVVIGAGLCGSVVSTLLRNDFHVTVVEQGRKNGHTFSQPDLIIAATALHHGLTIVSRDTSEYETAIVPVLNPWTTTR